MWAKSGSRISVNHNIKRHLIYHIYPVKNTWQWNIEQLNKYIDIFNGKKIISIVVDNNTDDVSDVKDAIRSNAQFFEFENDPNLGETKTLPNALQQLCADTCDITFYAHAKGVTRQSAATQAWTNAMYTINLSAPYAIDALLKKYHSVGCFKLENNHDWYYAGTYFWFRNSSIRDYIKLENHKYGVEQFLKKYINSSQAHSLFNSGKSLYDEPVLSNEYDDAIKKLYSMQLGYLHKPTISFIIPTCGRTTLRRTLDSILNAGFGAGDEVLVIGDGKQPIAQQICGTYNTPIIYLEYGPTHDFGNSQRNEAIKLAKCDFIAFIDDDDEYRPRSIVVARDKLVTQPEKLHLFRMEHRNFGILWKDKEVRHCNISSQMAFVPNKKGLLHKWINGYEGDFWFIQNTSKNFDISWNQEILAIQH